MSLSVRVPRRLETSILFDKLEPPWYPVSRLVFTEGAFLRLCQGVPHLATYPLFFTEHTSLPSGKGETDRTPYRICGCLSLVEDFCLLLRSPASPLSDYVVQPY